MIVCYSYSLLIVSFVVFFFQAEDGIRDLVRSRGLGDVYKRQVVSINKTGSGYGKHVLIDHGYGYKTLYAHMHTITVKEGEKVKKGQKIGLVGSTGASTAPHLHYEVWINGNAINPIDYVLDGLSPKEYRELVKKATQDNQSFD